MVGKQLKLLLVRKSESYTTEQSLMIESLIGATVKYVQNNQLVTNVICDLYPNTGEFIVENSDISDLLPIDSIVSVVRNDELSSLMLEKFMKESVVLDEAGNGLTVYHGTNHGSLLLIDDFVESDMGTLGSGIYFADKQNDASVYGDQVVSAFLCFKRPWVIELEYDSPMAIEEDFDHPAVEAILSLPNGRALLDRAKRHEFGHLDILLTRALVKQGFDSIIGIYPDDSKVYVAFHRNQVLIQEVIPSKSHSMSM